MAEFVEAVGGQTILANRPAVLTTSIACPKGFIIHDDGSGLITLRGITNRKVRYRVLASTNIAVPEGGTPGPISLGLFNAGSLETVSIGTVTPTVADAFFNVAFMKEIVIPCGCCRDIFIGNATASGDPIVTDGSLNVIIERKA